MTTYSADTPVPIGARNRWAVASGLSRLIMVPPLAIMLRISARYILDPVHAAASTGVSLATPEALTDTRVVGALALTIAAVIASATLSRRRLRTGHATIAGMMACILAVRLFGFAHDGTTLAMGDQRVKTAGEVVFLALNLAGYVMQTYGSKRAEVRR